MMFINWRKYLLAMLLLFATGSVPILSGTATSEKAFADDADAYSQPETVAYDTLNDWTLGGGLLYWAKSCVMPEESPDGYYLKRMPAGRGEISTLATVDHNSCNSFKMMVADDSGVYYHNAAANRIEKIALTTPVSSPTVVADNIPVVTAKMVVDETYLYFANGSNQIRRVLKTGGTPVTVITANARVQEIVVDFISVYWFDATGLWWAEDKSCTSSCVKNRLSTITGRHLMIAGMGFAGKPRPAYFVTTGQTQQINKVTCSSSSPCDLEILYTAIDSDWQLGQLAGAKIYAEMAGFTHIIWTETKGTPESKIRRMSISGGSADEISQLNYSVGPALYVDNEYAYFANITSNISQIYRLPLNANKIERDFVVDNWEVTQVIQNLNNDVPLVADKRTAVRVFGHQNGGADANTVEAQLYGWRNGSPLPESPLSSANGPRYLSPSFNWERGNLDHGWLFELPNSWDDPGDITLEVVIDPRGMYDDPDRMNNTLSDSFTFNPKGPLCIVAVPVRTSGTTASIDDPEFWPIVNGMTMLYPIPDTWDYHLNEIAEYGFDSYEIPDDGDSILAKLWTRNLFTDDPDECPGNQAYYYGMVHSSATTAYVGKSYISGDEAWGVMRPESGFVPLGSTLMAHEIGHNLGREHIDCEVNDPEGREDLDLNYPYDPCTLGPDQPDAYYGYNPQTQRIIQPLPTGDFMSYAHNIPKPLWISDYTYRALYNQRPDGIYTRSLIDSPLSTAVTNAGETLIINGVINHEQETAVFDFGYRLPQGLVSADKLARLAANIEVSTPAKADYIMRLLDNNEKVIAELPFNSAHTSDHASGHTGAHASEEEIFNLIMPFDSNTAVIALYAGDQELARRKVSPSAPTVKIITPNGFESIHDRLYIEWHAFDANGDKLGYTVQYSADSGKTWQSLAANISGHSLTIENMKVIPGSDQAVIRVIATDGVNIGVDTSDKVFQVTNKPPQLAIIQPQSDVDVPAGSTIKLVGRAYDAEDGQINDVDLRWSIDGQIIGVGSEQAVAGLAPGTHQVSLTAQDSNKQTSTVHTTVNVMPLQIAQGTNPMLDGYCDEASYANGTTMQLAPYQNGTQATVFLLHTDDALWACFSGMERGSHQPIGFAGLRVDIDNSGDSWVQTDDFGFFVGEDGAPSVVTGDGEGVFQPANSDVLSARTRATDTLWWAELRIDASALGGWDHPIRLSLGHFDNMAARDDYQWPFAATRNQPKTWALTDWDVLPVTGKANLHALPN